MQQIIWDKLSFQRYLLTFKFTKSNSKELQKSKKLSPLSQMPLFDDLYTIAIMQGRKNFKRDNIFRASTVNIIHTK